MVEEIKVFGDLVESPQFDNGIVTITVKTDQISLARFNQLRDDLDKEKASVQVSFNFPSVR